METFSKTIGGSNCLRVPQRIATASTRVYTSPLQLVF